MISVHNPRAYVYDINVDYAQKHFVVEDCACMTLWRILRKSLRCHSAVGF